MRIKEFLITRYGPLKSTGRILLNGFNLIWGRNEEGKTLTIDALIKLLIGFDTKILKIFGNINRVEEMPEGYVIVKDNNGKEIKLPERKKKINLIQITDLSPQEFRNIFIIRNSDLSILEEEKFYVDITDKLTGLKTQDILKIKNKLLDIGNLTPGGDFKDDIQTKKLKSRLERAKNLKEKIIDLENKIKEKALDKLEEALVRLKDEIEKINKQIENLDIARKREKYEIGKEALIELKKALENLKNLKNYNEEDWHLWRDCEKSLEEYKSQKEEKIKELKEKEIELKEINQKLNEIKSEFKILEEKKKKIDEEIKAEISNYSRINAEVSKQKVKDRFFTYLGITSTILLGLSLIGLLFVYSLLFYGLIGLFLIIAIISGIFKFQLLRKEAQLSETLERIKFALSEIKIGGESFFDIQFNLSLFKEEFRKKDEKLRQIEIEKEKIEEKIEELSKKIIPTIENKIQKAKETIEEIKRKSGESSLEKYTENLKIKQKFEKIIEAQESILKAYFGEEDKTSDRNIAYWEEKIRKYEEYKNKVIDIKYDEAFETNLKNRKKELEKKIKELTDQMESFYKEMEEVEREANRILELDEYLYCNTLADLEKIKNKLESFIRENEEKRELILTARKIFEEIEKEEINKISELFGKESPISSYFAEITEGRYEEVIFEQEKRKIKVKLKKDVLLEPEKLSGGAYDQLYFSIRLALGEKLLKGDKGFFILDDPFIKSDPYRLKKQIEMLKKISELGWQIIYFSAKGEVKEILDKEIKTGVVNYIELNPTYAILFN